MTPPRSPLRITLSVWKALFLRESISRLFSARGAWFWLLAEPMLHMAFLIFVFTVIRVRTVGGIDTVIWLVSGLMAFFVFRRTATQVMNGINANQSLFAYRQVKPMDALLVRAGLEVYVALVSATLLLSILALFGQNAIPENLGLVLEAFFGLWLLGLGFGLMASVAVELVPELGKVIDFVMLPLYMLSGVIFPISAVPAPYSDWLLLNPVVHGIEGVRLGFAPFYHAPPQLSMAYLYLLVLVFLFFGLALQRKYASKLVTQ